ncbi:MAG: CotH kinase family protein [Bacteroidetes bacterium]|nr:CotH kinase family protein [Bacteroidota bacterium]
MKSVLTLLLFPFVLPAQVPLPQVSINTSGAEIPNEPKITASLTITENGAAALTTPIGIEIRGSSSQWFPKKSYGFETRDAFGEDVNLSLLGLPKESDWILYAPYTDKSMIRDVMTFDLSRKMGHYASRFRYVELTLNDDYQGIYILEEKIKRDKNRVDVSKLDADDNAGDSLTGGYILKVDKMDGSWGGGWNSIVQVNGFNVPIQYHDPVEDELTDAQKTYIQTWFTGFETMLNSEGFADPVEGYPNYIDLPSFVDFVILNELGKNVDGYRLSSFLYKKRDSKSKKLFAGPMWDFNLAYGNADYYEGYKTSGFQYEWNITYDGFQLPFWWNKLCHEPHFQDLVKTRWTTLRKTILHADTLKNWIYAQHDILKDAAARNYQKWPILGQYVWPNYYIGSTYLEEIGFLNGWLQARIKWLDRYLPGQVLTSVSPGGTPERFEVSEAVPNPFNPECRLSFRVTETGTVTAGLFDLTGRKLRTLWQGTPLPGETVNLRIDGSDLASGLYLIRITAGHHVATRKAVLIR